MDEERRQALTPAEFEEFVVGILRSTRSSFDDFRVTLHEQVEGVDGTYEFDATVRYRWGGLEFLVVVEAKRYTHPVKRAIVQELHSKIQSVGAHKGVVIATSPFQRGAVTFAQKHGIALATVRRGEVVLQTRADPAGDAASPTIDRWSGPPLVAETIVFEDGAQTAVTIWAESRDLVRELWLGDPRLT